MQAWRLESNFQDRKYFISASLFGHLRSVESPGSAQTSRFTRQSTNNHPRRPPATCRNYNRLGSKPAKTGKYRQIPANVPVFDLAGSSAGFENAKLGQQAKIYMDAGQLVPDAIVVGLIKERIKQADCKAGYILDGFPRNLVQAERLSETLKTMDQNIDSVIDIEVDVEELIGRLTGRTTCKCCGAMFHQRTHPPLQRGVCDECGGELFKRPDDNKETILKRMQVYENETTPLKGFYKREGNLKTIPGQGTVDEVFIRVCALVS